MTTLELATDVIRHGNPNSLGALGMSQLREVANAMSSGLSEFFTYSPDTLKRTTASVTLAAPQTISIGVTNGSNDVTIYEFDCQYHGCTVMVDGIRNEVTSETTLLNSWEGTTGTKTAILYQDAVPFGGNKSIRRIANDPWLVRGGGNNPESYQLRRGNHDHAPTGEYQTGNWGARYGHGSLNTFSGWNGHFPTHYAILETGNSQNPSDQFILKVMPSANESIVLRFDLEFDPEMVDWWQVVNFPITLPVSDSQYHGILRPLVEYEMMSCSFWNGSDIANRQINTAYERARAQIDRIPTDRAPKQNRIGTPFGW